MDLGTRFASVIANTTYEDLPQEAILASKMAIADTLGVMLAGSGAGEDVEKVVGLAAELGGKEECSIVGFGTKSNAVLAAMANGALAHSIDYDDVHDDAFVHPSASVVPAALTVGETLSSSGKDLIVAVTLGNDLMCRMGYAVSNPKENDDVLWMLPVLLGTFSATATVSKLMGLDKEKVENALGIAYNRAGGSKQMVIEPGSLRGLYAMFPNMTGTLSALLAKNGVQGLRETFNGQAGFFSQYYNNIFDENAFDDLGQKFEASGISIKPWPCCRFTNSHVDAAISLSKENNIVPAEVSKITIYYADENAKRCIEPLEARRAPQSIPEAKLSLPFTVAQAIAYQKIEIGDFSKESLRNPVLLDLCKKNIGHIRSVSRKYPLKNNAARKSKDRDAQWRCIRKTSRRCIWTSKKQDGLGWSFSKIQGLCIVLTQKDV